MIKHIKTFFVFVFVTLYKTNKKIITKTTSLTTIIILLFKNKLEKLKKSDKHFLSHYVYMSHPIVFLIQ